MRLIRLSPRPLRHPKPVKAASVVVLCAASFTLGMGTPQGNAHEALPTTPATSAPANAACPNPDPNLWPFGVVCGRDFNVPSPPESPSLVPTFTTKTTTRIWGENPFQEAVSVTQHEWPAVIPENAPGETDN